MMILSLMPADLKEFLSEIESLGARLCLVGGASRDFLASGILSNDLDFEVRGVPVKTIKDYFKTKGLSFSELPYEIVRIDFRGFDLEFSGPRLENPLMDNKSHHHFEAILDQSLSYDRAFARRDFTLNAIGVECSFKNETAKVIDPFNGVKDLENKVLREISDYFFLDSVRFLRLIRFHVKYNFAISESIINQIGLFDLSQLSLHHFREELRKSRQGGIFVNEFVRITKTYQLKVSEAFKFWNDYHFGAEVETADDLLVAVFKKNPEDAKKVAAFFLMPDKRLKDLKSFDDSYQAVFKLSSADLETLSKKGLNDNALLNVLRDLKNLEEKKEWRSYYPEHLIISWDDWEDVSVANDELQNTEAPLRSYVRYYKTLQKVCS